MAQRTRCAIVGIGHRAYSWLGQMAGTYEDVTEVVGLCDRLADRCHDANKYARTNAAVYTDYDRMLAELRPDMVVVVSPEHVHGEHIVKALDAGCEVATEKPLCTQPRDAIAILEAETRNNRRVFMGFNYRHIPLASRIREIVLEGIIGTPISMDLTWYLDYRGHGASYFRRWHRLMERSGGLLITKATHHFDLANWWMNDRPASVYARCSRNFFGAGHGRFRGERCRDCAHAADCQFHYDILDKERKARELDYAVPLVRDYEGDTCVFSDDIDIYDTHAVMVQYANGGVLNYSLNASVPFEGWNLAINGTRGRLESNITDAKPLPGWQQHVKVTNRQHRVLSNDEIQVVSWPDHYTIHVMPHDRNGWQERIPNIAEGHGGGDFRIFDACFRGTLKSSDPLGLFASAGAGVHSMIIGAAANQSAASGMPVQISDLLGAWA